eukprot:TRINITY_DN66356_c1_g4_i1.p2 TRINITY_DN66356_c1_g4~~TRINITY_DN66356_c1_g4_i1.p2  ORF type:complete len:538 (-),score=326.18 TRINITY_DN66356_c1_g4_i1:69-1661(-)
MSQQQQQQQQQKKKKTKLTTEEKEAVEALVLSHLAAEDEIKESGAWWEQRRSSFGGVDHIQLVGVLKSLEAAEYVKLETHQRTDVVLKPEALQYIESGSPEVLLYKALPEAGGVTKAELGQTVSKQILSVGLSKCMKMKPQWVVMDKATKTFQRNTDAAVVAAVERDEVKQQLQQIAGGKADALSAGDIKELSKRKLLSKVSTKTYGVSKAAKFRPERKKLATDLTPEMLRTDAWKEEEFKEYNFAAKGQELDVGCLHPLMKVRTQFRSILLEMGFEEMPTNNFVESSFWNFDSLFQPQQHPARDSHDTFFLVNPEKCGPIPDQEYQERVRKQHEVGGYGSIGYRYDWSLDEAQKNILRTHTTAVSARMLYKLANQPGGFQPKKYFSIDRVFRNESLDSTHLAEFHQVEGLVADRGLTLGDLIGVIGTFFKRIGITDLRFKPAFNPYTEPSMEIFGFSKDLNKWIEIGNSGMFRPEMLQPMGIPEDVRVIAWGLSLERPTMIKYGIDNIRDLFGHKMKISLIQKNPIARF